MTIFEQLQAILRKERDSGSTNQSIGDRVGLSHAHINRLLNGSADRIESLKFGTVLKLFPGLIRIVDKDGQISQTNSPGAVVAIGENSIANTKSNDNIKLNNQLMSNILNDDEICDSCKVRILKILQAQ